MKNNRKIWRESDSLNIVNCLWGLQTPTWTIKTLFDDTLGMLISMDNFTTTHVFQEGNKVVDDLANIGVKINIIKWAGGARCCPH